MTAQGDMMSTLEINGVSEEMFVTSVRGREQLGQPYEWVVTVAMRWPLDDSVIEAAMKGAATLNLDNVGGGVVRGLIREVSVASDRTMAGCTYHFVMVPRLWYLSQNVHSRSFLDHTLNAILQAVVAGGGVDPMSLELTDARPARPFTFQFEESDLDFVHRWIEREGVSYYFTHEDGGIEKLIFTDNNSAMRNQQVGLFYQPTGGLNVSNGERVVWDAHEVQRIVPIAATERDWFTAQAAKVSQLGPGSKPGAWPGGRPGDGWVVHFGDLQAPDAPGRAPTVRKEIHGAQARRVRLSTTAKGVHAGWTVVLDGHPIQSLNGEYIVVAAEHFLEQEGFAIFGEDEGKVGYYNVLECIPVATPWRSPRTTPWPRIAGLMHAIVDEQAHDATMAGHDTDDLYKVFLPYDESGKPTQHLTIPIRRIQPYAGPGYGQHYPLHQGTGVMLAFVNGDPDRPFIVGALHDQVTPEIAEIVPHKTRGAVRSRSGVVLEYDDDA